jgi:hypothetical protein
MSHSVRLSDLRALSPDERAGVLDQLANIAAAPTNGQSAQVYTRIREYERRYEMTSRDLLAKLSRNEVRETREIADWLFWLQVQRRGEKARPEPAK